MARLALRLVFACAAIAYPEACASLARQSSGASASSPALAQATRIIYANGSVSGHGDGTKSRPFATIQSAIDAAHPGDAVYVAPGSYRQNVRLASHVSLVGAGPDMTTVTAPSGAILTAERVVDITIEGITLDGANLAETGFVCDWEQPGMYHSFAPPSVGPVVFRGNTAKGLTGVGVLARYARVLVQTNSVSHTLGDGIVMGRCESTVRDNRVSSTDTGIVVTDGRSEITGNTIVAPRRDGIVAHDLAWCVVRGNRVTGSGGHGIVCENGRALVRENTVTESKQAGLTCSGGAAVVARRNRISGCGSPAVAASAPSYPDLGRYDDWGRNVLHANTGGGVTSNLGEVVPAVGNWWGSDPPDPSMFHGRVDYEPWLNAPE